MTVRFKLQSKRAAATFFFFILLCFSYQYNFEGASAVIAGLLLGGIHGAGAAGLFLMTVAVKNGMEDFNVMQSAFLFLSSAVSGLISGYPKEKIGKKEPLKIVTASVFAMGLFTYSMFLKNSQAFSEKIFLYTAQTGICILVSLLLRPVAAKILYPENKINDELNDLMKNKNKEVKI